MFYQLIESFKRKMPVVIFDFGSNLQRMPSMQNKWQLAENQYFSIVNIRDFYQIPVMIAEMGLKIHSELTL